ncbi:MAG: hypothetical protein ACTHK0_02005 [Ginsengibacter sp.]
MILTSELYVQGTAIFTSDKWITFLLDKNYDSVFRYKNIISNIYSYVNRATNL